MSILTILATTIVTATVANVNADPDTGNNGQCRQGTETTPKLKIFQAVMIHLQAQVMMNHHHYLKS